MDQKAKAKGQLFLGLEVDGIDVDIAVINKAMEGDGQALFSIGYIYDIQRQQYDKAMDWYLLSAAANYAGAQNNIGNMYYIGSGVPVDYLLALEWYLKAASQKNKFAFENIGRIFEKGLGVLDDKYMALEWYRRNKHTAEAAKRLKDKGYHVPAKKKKKKIDQLITETEEIIKEEKLKRCSPEEYKPLPELNSLNERDIKTRSYNPNSLEDDLRSMFSLSFSKHDSDKESYKPTDELSLLKQEREILEQQVQSLETEKHTHKTVSVLQSENMDALKKENQVLKQANNSLEQQNHDLKKANESLTHLLETKSTEFELINQSMQQLLDKEKQKMSRLEKENRKLKRELNDASSTQDSMKDDDPSNDINYDTEVESYHSDNDISYNTPAEFDDDNHDLNYDSDEKTSSTNEKSTSTGLE